MKFFVTGVGGQLGHDVMNELLKRARLTGFVDAPELEKALAENRRAEEAIFEAYLPERKQHGN